MVKKIQVTGNADKEGVITLKMDEKVLEVKTEETLTANNLYEFFCYKRGVTYEVVRGAEGKVRKDSYEAFCKLIEDIAEKLSSIKEDIGEDNIDQIETDALTEDSEASDF